MAQEIGEGPGMIFLSNYHDEQGRIQQSKVCGDVWNSASPEADTNWANCLQCLR